MNYLFGLGNPGPEYHQTRHNVGFMVAEAMAQVLGGRDFTHSKKFQAEICSYNEWLLVKPQTFMNRSGETVRSVLQFYKIVPVDSELRNVYVVHDDLDLELGKYKLQLGTGPKVHNGLISVYQHLGTEQFWHVRVGVDGRQGQRTMPGSAYVLQQFSPEERELLNSVIGQVVESLLH